MATAKKKQTQSSKRKQDFIEYTIDTAKDLLLEYKSIEYINEDPDSLQASGNSAIFKNGKLDLSKVSIAYQTKVNFHREKKIVSIYFIISYQYEKGIIFLKYGLRVDFLIHNYDDVVKINSSKEANISKDYLVSFFGITLSTARGILLSHLRGTDYEKLSIPFYYPDEILEKFVGPHLMNDLIK